MRTEAETEPARISRSWSSRHTLTNEIKASEGRATIRKGEGRRTDNTQVPAQGGMRRYIAR
jgi:hypothetical protein